MGSIELTISMFIIIKFNYLVLQQYFLGSFTNRLVRSAIHIYK